MSQGSCLQLDLGNSGLKWRLVDGGEVMMFGTARDGDLQSRLASIQAESVDSIWVASVAAEDVNDELAAGLRKRWGRDVWFAATAECTNGLVNSYADPARMGVDRWLAMLGAREHSGGRLCVVDAGSALTIDLVDARGQHEGGYIIPGAGLMERALMRDTQRVRFDGGSDSSTTPGTNTAAAVQNGINLALCASVDAAVSMAEVSGPAPTILVTGGDGVQLVSLLPRESSYFAELVFEGLSIMGNELNGLDI